MIYLVETGSQLNAKYNLYNSNQSNCNRAISYYYATRRRCGERRPGGSAVAGNGNRGANGDRFGGFSSCLRKNA